MDAKDDVIVGTAKGYGWAGFKNYAVSLSESGFRGRKILFVCDITSVARAALTRLGFELIEYQSVSPQTNTERFKILADWLAHEKDKTRYILHCDVRDLVFQSDPSVWMESHPAKLWGTTESILYRDDESNKHWVRQVYGQEILDEMMDSEVICAGTIAGEAETVFRVAQRIYESSFENIGSSDQAAYNRLLRTEFADDVTYPAISDGFVLTSGWWLIGRVKGHPERAIGQCSLLCHHPPVLRDGIAYPEGSDEPFAIVHQYERGDEWKPEVNSRWACPFPVEDDSAEAEVIASKSIEDCVVQGRIWAARERAEREARESEERAAQERREQREREALARARRSKYLTDGLTLNPAFLK